jgi:2-amino-4-hydroxy-6-hydroxymethyldihydropteridine diphosphokinase
VRGSSKRALLALGANLPFEGHQPADSLRRALALMPGEGLQVQAVSRFFRTPCFPAGAGPDYVNAAAAVLIPARMSAEAVLQALHRIEQRLGRTRDTRWGMRTADLDLLALEDAVLPDRETQQRWQDLAPDQQALRAPEALVLPHPRLQDRAFVLVPLADVAADWRHPLSGLSVAEMVARLPEAERREVRAEGCE